MSQVTHPVEEVVQYYYIFNTASWEACTILTSGVTTIVFQPKDLMRRDGNKPFSDGTMDTQGRDGN